MEHFIELNLHSDSEKAEVEKIPRTEERESIQREKALNRVAKMAAHKGAKKFAHERFGIFSK